MNEVKIMLEIRKALQFFLKTLDPDTQADMILAVPSLYDEYKKDKEYKIKEVFAYGVNSVGDPQLYQVLNDHTSAKEWEPDKTPTLYKPIGVTEDGYPEWAQPLGATDAYNTGDIVSYNGVLYESIMDANVYPPDVCGWEKV